MQPLGDLETAVMERIWAIGPADVKRVHKDIGRRRAITLNTVQSTMERLFRKALLAREKVSHAYVYSARVTREELARAAVAAALERVASGETETMLAAFVDLAARAGDDTLDRLEAMIAARRGSKR
jgi:predicted transcriptional regulator